MSFSEIFALERYASQTSVLQGQASCPGPAATLKGVQLSPSGPHPQVGAPLRYLELLQVWNHVLYKSFSLTSSILFQGLNFSLVTGEY